MNSVLQLLRSKVIPWTTSEQEQRLVVANPIIKETVLPPGASLSSRPLKGKRVIVKGSRRHANLRTFTAEWPEANQQEMALPKLACVVSGRADYLLGNYCLHANEGTFILIPPHAPHHRKGPFLDKNRSKEDTCTVLFAYTYSHGTYFWFSRSADGHHTNNMFDNYLIPNGAAVQTFNLLMGEAISGEPQSGSICKSLLFTFFTILTREIEAGRYMSPIPHRRSMIQNPSSTDFKSHVQGYIRANLHKRLKVEDAAGQMYMSGSHFSRTIRQETGFSFVELLIHCRIERAKELLKKTDWTVTCIASYIGLKSTNYFHELFQKSVGSTPVEYRQKYQEQNESDPAPRGRFPGFRKSCNGE